jgi:hypothetical protein
MSINTEVSEKRARIEALKAERREIWAQARSRDEVQQCVHDQVVRWEAEAQIQLRRDLRNLAAGHRNVKLLDGDVVAGEVALARTLVLLLGADEVQRVLLRCLEDVPLGLDNAARNQRLFEIDDELTALETEEEALIEQSEELGTPVMRRADARPEIVIGARDPFPATLPRSPLYTASEARTPRRAPRAVPSTYVGSRTE